MPVHRRTTPSINFAGTHTWVERGTVRVKCLAQEHNTMSPARVRTWIARSGDKRTNQEATAPPTRLYTSRNKTLEQSIHDHTLYVWSTVVDMSQTTNQKNLFAVAICLATRQGLTQWPAVQFWWSKTTKKDHCDRWPQEQSAQVTLMESGTHYHCANEKAGSFRNLTS